VGETRIATRLSIKGDGSTKYEEVNTYYYHADHLGSAQLISDSEGKEYERIEYTPYGESWIEKASDGLAKLPYRFTGKERDSETGLYYYGARYLNPTTGLWLSTDPALAEYLPVAPVDDEAKKHNEKLPGMGGAYNLVNLALYHYAGNNPVRYTDPTGLVLEWIQEDGVSDEVFSKTQDEARKIMESDTECGRRMKELSESDTKVVIHVSKIGRTNAEAFYPDDASSGVGSGTDVNINITDVGKTADGVKLTLGEILAHEVSGHAYDNYKGTSPMDPSKSEFINETVLRGLSEEVAVAMQNEYRVAILGSNKQRTKYTGVHVDWPMPIYNKVTKAWTLNKKPWRLR